MAESIQEQEVHVNFEIVQGKEKLATLDKILWVAREGEKAPSKSVHEVVEDLVSQVQQKCDELDMEMVNRRKLWIETLAAVITLAKSIIQVEVAKKSKEQQEPKTQVQEEKANA